MIRIYEGFLKPETCALPTRIVNQNPNQDDQPLMVNTKVQLFFEGHKNLRHLPYGFNIYFLLRKAEL